MPDLSHLHGSGTLSWCLFCHRSGHRSSICSEVQPIFIPVEHSDDQLARQLELGIRVDDRVHHTPIGQLMNQILMRKEHIKKHTSYKTRRDALFIDIDGEMVHRGMPEEVREFWVQRMAEWNNCVDHSLDMILERIEQVEENLNADKRSNEDIREYLTRLPDEEGTRIAAKLMKELESCISAARHNDQFPRSQLIRMTSNADEDCKGIEDLSDVDRLWVMKAFLVTMNLQPEFRDCHYAIFQYTYPDIEQVVARAKFHV